MKREEMWLFERIPQKLVDLARNNPMVHAHIRAYMDGQVAYEQMLESCVLALAEHNAKLSEINLKLAQNQTTRIIDGIAKPHRLKDEP